MIDIDNTNWDNFVLAKSGRTVKLLYNKELVQVCTSSLYTPFGVKSVNKDWSNFSEYNLDCSINNAMSGGAITFQEFLEKLDKKIQTLAQENIDIFARNGGETSDFVYTPILRENGNYPKLMKLQLSRDKNGNFTSVLFDENKTKIMIDESNINELLTKGKIFKCIIECSKVWYFNGKLGSIWNVVQLKFSERKGPSTQNPYTTLMIDE
jgi:hypothetical protein